ncbi:MAG: tRNA (N(6)-L-threonylcarbamoyladenosine(37)-C(2))-methylthiotransferase [Promethearchaeota archaeon]
MSQTFYIETYGCTSNKADSAIISEVLRESGFHETDIRKAEFIIINTCAVKEQTENKIKARLKDLHEKYGQKHNKYLIVAGCLPHITPNYINVVKSILPSFAAIIDLNNINEIPEIFKIIKKGAKNLVLHSEKSIDKSQILINPSKKTITGIVPISEGCLGACTYCCVKNARGRLKCYAPENIIRNVYHQLYQGIKELYLTSQDCGIYEYGRYQLADLVNRIVANEYKFFLRIGMINPSFLKHHLDQLITIYKLDKVYHFLHIPIQSGSNQVLKKMQRTYIISDIIEPIYNLRKFFPNLTISTDIICGFPGETEYDFLRTINLIKWLKPEILNISKFTARPGTKAKKMKQLESKLIKERSIKLSKVFRNSLKNMNKKWIGWRGNVLVLHEDAEKNQAFGRNFAYKNIFIENYSENYGKFLEVKIEKVIGFNLFGKQME